MTNVASLSTFGDDFDRAALNDICTRLMSLAGSVDALESSPAHDHETALLEQARLCCDVVVADDLWSLDWWAEMLFIL
ncbi:MAG: hypothetical protein ACLPVY_02620 [Acidimicrobiia bacterium]